MDMNNYIADLYEYLNEERLLEVILKKSMSNYQKLVSEEEILTVSELRLVVVSIALHIVIPFSAPISVALTDCSAILRSTSGLINKKVKKKSKIELLAMNKLNSIEKYF